MWRTICKVHVEVLGGTGACPRSAYLAILISHIILAATVPFLAIITIYLGLRDRRLAHRRLARTFPIWLYRVGDGGGHLPAAASTSSAYSENYNCDGCFADSGSACDGPLDHETFPGRRRFPPCAVLLVRGTCQACPMCKVCGQSQAGRSGSAGFFWHS